MTAAKYNIICVSGQDEVVEVKIPGNTDSCPTGDLKHQTLPCVALRRPGGSSAPAISENSVSCTSKQQYFRHVQKTSSSS